MDKIKMISWFYSRKTLLFFLFIPFCFLFLFLSVHFSPSQKIKISISQVIDHPALNETKRGIVDGLRQAGYQEDKNIHIEYENAQGKPELATQIAQKFVGDAPTILVGIGTSVSQALAFAARKQKIPLVFASVTDPVAAKLVNSFEKPGGPVTGVSNFTALGPQFDLFKKCVPSLKELGIIYNPGEANSLVVLEKAIEEGKNKGIRIVAVTAVRTSEVSSAARSLLGRVQAIYINNDNTALAAFESIVKEAKDIPVFASDTDLVERGAFAALGPNQYDLGIQVSHLIVRILKGEKASQIPVEFAKKLETKLRTPSGW